MPHQSLSLQERCYLWSPFYLALCQRDTVKAFTSSLFLTPASCVFPLSAGSPHQSSLDDEAESGQTAKRFACHRAFLPFSVTADKLYFPLFLSLQLFCIQNLCIFCVKILVLCFLMKMCERVCLTRPAQSVTCHVLFWPIRFSHCCKS